MRSDENMNYNESKVIEGEIEKAQNILINCHKDPDPDSVGSALALYEILTNIGKNVAVICPGDVLYDPLSYLSGYDKIQKNVNFAEYDFSKYDLFISLDSSSLDRVTGDNNIKKLPVRVVVIDHHKTNEKYGQVNLVDGNKTSVGELLFDVIEDIGLKITKDVADCLLAAIIGDTGAFRYPKLTVHTFQVAAKLMQLGGDKDKAIHHIFRSENFNVVKFWGEVLSRMQFNEKGKYVWSVIPYEIFEKYGKPKVGKETAASFFTQNIKDSDFGFIAVEEEKGLLKISFRSRTGFDTSRIALELKGGGHVYAAGATIANLEFGEAVQKLLDAVDKIVAERDMSYEKD